jgi:polyisoprenoid-binding protein YceI
MVPMTLTLRLALRAFVLPAMVVAFTAACPAQTTPAPAAAKADAPAAAQPAPAAATSPAAPTAAGATTYVLDPAKSRLEFQFRQAGADSKGQFKKYNVTLTSPGADPTGGKLEVTVDVGSLDTEDGERDTTLRDVDLFNVNKYPTARFVAEKLTKVGAGYEANGKLTIRDVTRDVKVPLAFKPMGNGGQLTGKTAIKRLDFGVGQGEWKSTEWVDDQVTVVLDLHLTRK